MFITRIIPNPRHHAVAEKMKNPFHVRELISGMFPDNLSANHEHRKEMGLLFRIDRTQIGDMIIAQSLMEPNIDVIPDEYGEIKVINISNLLRQIETGNQYAYRITGNTIHREQRNNNNLKSISPEDIEGLTRWWERRAEKTGITIDSTYIQSLSTHKDPYKKGMSVRRTQYEGQLTVNDPDKLRTAIQEGIGRAKPYGCGLLSIKRT